MEIRIRDVDEWVVEYHRKQAKSKKTSLEKELRSLLTDVAMAKRKALAKKLTKHRDTMKKKYGVFSDSTPLIREERDRRG